MFKEIMYLIVKYNNENKIVDDNFYIELFNILKKDPNLSNYVNGLILINKNNKSDPKYKRYVEGLAGIFGQASYDTLSNDLVIYTDNINSDVSNRIADFHFNSSDSITIHNLMVLQIMLHEIEHIKQKRSLNKGNDFESELLRAVYSSEPETSYTYQYSLTERLAEIRSYEQILSIYENIGIGNQEIYDYFEKTLKDVYLNGYYFVDENGYESLEDTEELMSPTEEYVKNKNCDKATYRTLAISVDEEQRFLYGMPISLEKYQKSRKETNLKL